VHVRVCGAVWRYVLPAPACDAPVVAVAVGGQAGVVEGALILAMAGIMSTKSMLLLVDCKYELINLRSKGQGGDMLHRLKVSVRRCAGDRRHAPSLL
jgi:hypothetical protein